jgi:hypothetical protein
MPVLRSVLSYRLRESDVAGLEIQFGFRRGAEDFGASVVELAFPAGDYNRREAVADQVYAGAARPNGGTGILPVGQVGVSPA